MSDRSREVWITGIGLLSSLGEGGAHHLTAIDGAAAVNDTAFAPYPVHALAGIDFSKQIPKKSDLRQMEGWQRIGVHGAGLALDDAAVARKPELLGHTNLLVAAGSGERDTTVDGKVLESISTGADTAVLAKEILPTALRPTLFLAQLSNLLAGNISIIHAVTGSSRTFMGEEISGVSAVENAVRRIGAGQGDLFLVGGALNAERADLLLGYELGCNLWAHPFAPVWERRASGGGFVPGSAGAFLVLEARGHAEARGARPYARISAVSSDRASRTAPDDIRASLTTQFDNISGDLAQGPLAVLSGASGAEPATLEELDFLLGLEGEGYRPAIRAYGSRLGHSVEAHFPLGVALAALSLAAGRFYAPFDASGVERAHEGAPDRILVTGVGHWRGEGLALIERVDAAREVV
jgi:3-oxoacyl-[acyl-carrier-protein] synthase II